MSQARQFDSNSPALAKKVCAFKAFSIARLVSPEVNAASASAS